MRIVVEVDDRGQVTVTGARSPGSRFPIHAVVSAISSAVAEALARHQTQHGNVAEAPEAAAGGDALTGEGAGAAPPAAPAVELPDPLPATPEHVPAPERTTGQLRDQLAELLAEGDLDVETAAAALGCSRGKARHLLTEAGAL